MAAFSDYLENALLDHVLGGTAFTQPASVEVALFTSDAGELESNSTVNEVSGGSYARQTATFGAAAGGSASNDADISFTDMPAETVTHVAVVDGTGNVLFHGALTASKTLNAGDTFTIATGDLDITLD